MKEKEERRQEKERQKQEKERQRLEKEETRRAKRKQRTVEKRCTKGAGSKEDPKRCCPKSICYKSSTNVTTDDIV